MAANREKTDGSSADKAQILLAEYQALRAEIIHKQERVNLTYLAYMGGVPIFFTNVAEGKMFDIVLFLPLLALPLYLWMIHNEFSIAVIARYIRKKLEQQLLGRDGWEWTLLKEENQEYRNSHKTPYVILGIVVVYVIPILFMVRLWVWYNEDPTFRSGHAVYDEYFQRAPLTEYLISMAYPWVFIPIIAVFYVYGSMIMAQIWILLSVDRYRMEKTEEDGTLEAKSMQVPGNQKTPSTRNPKKTRTGGQKRPGKKGRRAKP